MLVEQIAQYITRGVFDNGLSPEYISKYSQVRLDIVKRNLKELDPKTPIVYLDSICEVISRAYIENDKKIKEIKEEEE